MKRALLLLLLTILGPGQISGLGGDGGKVTGPRTVKLGTNILSITNVDFQAGVWEADFYLVLVDPRPIEDDSFLLVNGRVLRKTLYWEEVDSEGLHRKEYRIQARFETSFQREDFPFDRHELAILIESRRESQEEIALVPLEGYSRVDPDHHLAGWLYRGDKVEVTPHHFGAFKRVTPQYRHAVMIGQVAFSAFVKTFGPMVILMVLVFLSLFLELDKLHIRSKMVNVAFLVSGFFHKTISNRVPGITYLTFADCFMFVTYGLLLVLVVYTTFLVHKQNQNRLELVGRLERSAKGLVLLGVPGAWGLLFLLWSW